MGLPLSETNTSNAKFGTLKGVFTPSVLTILGVIMYMRLGWVVGNVGLFGTLFIITISTAITFLTALSISATSTNMKVGGGGAYYMISRSLGVEAGAAVGVPLYLAQALGISFYLAGFSESLNSIFPDLSIQLISVVTLIVLTSLAVFSANLALKTQFLIFAIIIISLISFFSGSPISNTEASLSSVAESAGFWVVFAVFFPAVTGIEAGLSMSGDLKDAAKSLPLGTLMAVFVGYVVYIAIAVFLSNSAPVEELLTNPLVMMDIASVGQLVMLGLWGATLSSALGALLGAPRTLQALSKDNVVPRIFSKSSGKDDSPQYATAATFIVACGGIMLGDLNAIAPVLSMFFLTSYGVLNFSAGLESMISNPSWRPKFDTPWYLSILGGFLCLSAMFMIDAGSTIVSMILSFSIYYYMQRKRLEAQWGDMRRGILMFLARYSISKLSLLKENTKSWRPNLLVLSGAPTKRWYLVELAYAISNAKGFMTVATILPSNSAAAQRTAESKKTIDDFLVKRGVEALVHVTSAKDVITGAQALVRDYGLGPIRPNTIILGETEREDNFIMFSEMLIKIYKDKRNIVIVREKETKKDVANTISTSETKSIDVWWGRERHNAGLSLALGYMLQKSREWDGARLYLNSIATTSDGVAPAEKVLEDFLHEGRLEAVSKVYLADLQKGKEAIFNKIREESKHSDLLFLGMLPPDLAKYQEDPEKTVKEYASYYKQLLDSTRDFPTCALVLAAEDVNFHQIFSG